MICVEEPGDLLNLMVTDGSNFLLLLVKNFSFDYWVYVDELELFAQSGPSLEPKMF